MNSGFRAMDQRRPLLLFQAKAGPKANVPGEDVAVGKRPDVMPAPRKILFIGICASVLAAACWQKYAETNDDRAYFVPDGHIYRVELKGRRFPLVHDPISLLTESTREETFTLELPRIEGTIEAAEVHRSYLGRVDITKGRMTVDLYYRDGGARRPLSWNGEYTLLQKDSPATRRR